MELDGGQHSEDKQMIRDEIRTRWLASRGYRVLRVWNTDLKQRPNDILDMIVDALQTPLPALRAIPDQVRDRLFPLKGGRKNKLTVTCGSFANWSLQRAPPEW